LTGIRAPLLVRSGVVAGISAGGLVSQFDRCQGDIHQVVFLGERFDGHAVVVKAAGQDGLAKRRPRQFEPTRP
jgi:hypothetical protein